MNPPIRFSDAKRVQHVIAGAIACSVLIALPACQIPQFNQPPPGQVVPADYNVTRPQGNPSPFAAVVGGTCVGNFANGTTGPENSAQLGINEFFNDPALTRVIAQALAGNQELNVLNQEIQIASNEILFRRAAYLPLVSLRADAGVEKPGRFTPIGTVENRLEYFPGKHFPDPLPNYLLSANLFWQLDIWRELRNARDSAIQRYYAAIERRNFMVTRIVAEIAGNYYELLALDQRLEILTQTIAIQQQSQKVAEALKLQARGTELGVQRFLAEVRRNQSEKLIVTQSIIEAENRINFLAGRFPQPVERMSVNFVNLTLPRLNIGVPAQLLQNRADVRQAERELVASGLDVKVARARFFPRLDIMAGVGYEAFTPKYLFMTPESLIYNAIGELTAPLVNKRAIQAEYLTANARQLQSVYNYQRVVLSAYTDVVNRLSRAENYRKSIELKKQQLESLAAAVDLASKLFQVAQADYVDVLFAQRDLRDARTVIVETKQQQLTAIVNTYQALGGGYLLSSFVQEPVAPAVVTTPAENGGGVPTVPVPVPGVPPAPAAQPLGMPTPLPDIPNP